MSDFERPDYFGIEPLPAEFQGDLARLDEQVGAVIRAEGVPAGMEQRVLAATLAEVNAAHESAPLRLAGTEAVREPARVLAFSHWGRVAMAAGLGLAFAIGWWAMNGTPPSGSSEVAINEAGVNDGAGTLALAKADTGLEFVTVSLQRISPDSVTDMEGDFASLFETGNETSYDDLSAEFAALVTELSPGEM